MTTTSQLAASTASAYEPLPAFLDRTAPTSGRAGPAPVEARTEAAVAPTITAVAAAGAAPAAERAGELAGRASSPLSSAPALRAPAGIPLPRSAPSARDSDVAVPPAPSLADMVVGMSRELAAMRAAQAVSDETVAQLRGDMARMQNAHAQTTREVTAIALAAVRQARLAQQGVEQVSAELRATREMADQLLLEGNTRLQHLDLRLRDLELLRDPQLYLGGGMAAAGAALSYLPGAGTVAALSAKALLTGGGSMLVEIPCRVVRRFLVSRDREMAAQAQQAQEALVQQFRVAATRAEELATALAAHSAGAPPADG